MYACLGMSIIKLGMSIFRIALSFHSLCFGSNILYNLLYFLTLHFDFFTFSWKFSDIKFNSYYIHCKIPKSTLSSTLKQVEYSFNNYILSKKTIVACGHQIIDHQYLKDILKPSDTDTIITSRFYSCTIIKF